MSDKSPRQVLSKKSSQTLKQKRAAKRDQSEAATSTVGIPKVKQR